MENVIAENENTIDLRNSDNFIDNVETLPISPDVANGADNEDDVSCQSCGESFGDKNGMIVNICLHRICSVCIMKAINDCTKLDVLCPYDNEDDRCDRIISKEQIRLFDCDAVTDAYAAKEIYLNEKNITIKLCLNTKCEGFESCDESIASFVCNVCNKSNCLLCQAIHDEQTCAEYQDHVNRKSFICPVCTLVNSSTVYECEVCQEKNPDYVPDDSNYTEMLKMTKQAIVRNDVEFDCPVCFVTYEPGEGILLKSCLHAVCKGCLQYCIQLSETPDVKCPYINQNYSCTDFIADNEIREIVSGEILNRHLNKSIKMAEARIQNSFHCAKPDCNWWCEYEIGVNDVLCPSCFNLNCLNCKVIHDPKTCKEHQDYLKDQIGVETSEKLLKELIEKGEAMKCPGCNITLSKRDGCDFMTCSMCQIQICWVTKGPRWGPKGVGDISGGCRCNVQGQKCHPNCANCH